MNNDGKLLTTEEVAEILNVDPESVRRYTRTGELRSILLGGKFIRIDQEDLKSFIEQKKLKIQQSPPIKSGDIWYSPVNVYYHTQKETEKFGQSGLNKHPKYKEIREAQIASVIALVMFRVRNIPAFIQLYKPDPPDALIMQLSPINKGEMDISLVEITQYIGKNNESLFEQLKRTKIGPNMNTLSAFYILAVDLWPDVKIADSEIEQIRDYANANKIPYPIWMVQEKEKHPDTTAELTIVNPEIHKFQLNLGESAHLYNKLGIPGVITRKRTGNPDLVRIEKAEKHYEAPWETIEK